MLVLLHLSFRLILPLQNYLSRVGTIIENRYRSNLSLYMAKCSLAFKHIFSLPEKKRKVGESNKSNCGSLVIPCKKWIIFTGITSEFSKNWLLFPGQMKYCKTKNLVYKSKTDFIQRLSKIDSEFVQMLLGIGLIRMKKVIIMVDILLAGCKQIG